MQILANAINQILCCPTCKSDLNMIDNKNLKCISCYKEYKADDGIIVLMASTTEQQKKELELREIVAKQQANYSIDRIFQTLFQHHCVPIMSKRAKSFDAKFDSSQWILDVGCGTGYYWRRATKVNLILMDFAFANLKVAQMLLKDRDKVLFIQADAANLPIKNHSLSGIWSVQVTQHFPDEVMSLFMHELNRVLKDEYFIEIYNLNPALLHRFLYYIRGRKFHIKGKSNDMLLNLLNKYELLRLWKNCFNNKKIIFGYSELFFHPDLNCRLKNSFVMGIENFLIKMPWLASAFARQIQIEISSVSKSDNNI